MEPEIWSFGRGGKGQRDVGPVAKRVPQAAELAAQVLVGLVRARGSRACRRHVRTRSSQWRTHLPFPPLDLPSDRRRQSGRRPDGPSGRTRTERVDEVEAASRRSHERAPRLGARVAHDPGDASSGRRRRAPPCPSAPPRRTALRKRMLPRRNEKCEVTCSST